MTHLMLTSALLFALLAVVAIAICASLGIARDLVLDETDESAADQQSATARQAHAGAQPRGLAEDFGLGLPHAVHFVQDPGRSFSRSRSFNPRV